MNNEQLQQVADEAPRIIEESGLLINEETGEIVGAVAEASETKTRFIPDSREKLEWVFRKMMDDESAIAAINCRKNAVLQFLDDQIKHHQNRLANMKRLWEADIKEFVRKELAATGWKSKTYTTDYGKVSFRTTAGTNSITDMDAAVKLCEQNDELNDLVRVRKDVLCSELLARMTSCSYPPEEIDKVIVSSGPEERCTITILPNG